tara:strand:- start:9985 stop:10404 length:420 start_codon:yes stop_codon:yes gene_type:complete
MPKEIFSKQDDKLLLHMISRADEIRGRTDIAPEEQFLQLASLKLKKGTTFRPHKHIWKPGRDKVIAQESWVVIKGSVKAIFYDVDDTIVAEEILNAGDVSMTFLGGHNYEILEDDTLVYEYKTGPYEGQKKDKVFIDEF